MKILPPGRSDTTTSNFIKRLSTAKPLSIVRPNTVVSILPPVKITTTLKIKLIYNENPKKEKKKFELYTVDRKK